MKVVSYLIMLMCLLSCGEVSTYSKIPDEDFDLIIDDDDTSVGTMLYEMSNKVSDPLLSNVKANKEILECMKEKLLLKCTRKELFEAFNQNFDRWERSEERKRIEKREDLIFKYSLDIDFDNCLDQTSDGYLTFKDGYLISKGHFDEAGALTGANAVGNREYFKDMMRCFLEKLTLNYDYQDLKPMFRINEIRTAESAEDHLSDLMGMVQKYKIDKYLYECKDSSSIPDDLWNRADLSSFGGKEGLIDGLKMQFEKDSTWLTFKTMIDEDKFYLCLSESLLEKFTPAQMLSGEAYVSEEYDILFGSCLNKNVLKEHRKLFDEMLK